MKSTITTAERLNSAKQYRGLLAVQWGKQSVRDLVRIAGCNNAPELIAALERKGLEIDRFDRTGLDRDGRVVNFVVYQLSPKSACLADALVAEYAARRGLV